MIVYVLSKSGKPLMPTTPRKARLLLKSGKAKCIRRTPFTIKLLYDTTEYTQPLTHGIDTGSTTIGSAVADNQNNVLYLSEIQIRNNISDKMKQRSKYRSNRRNRKTRYRKARWLNRKNSIKVGRFSPTMRSKFNAHLKEINFVKTLLPISELILETAIFDAHALKNPAILFHKWLYQRGANYGFANTKAFVIDRDNHICQYCKGKSRDSKIEVHHIIYRCNGGSDESENLISLCKTCHNKVHDESIKLKLDGKQKGKLKHATQMNSIRIQLLKILKCKETFGFITKEHRRIMGLPKQHYMDAVAIACLGNVEKTGLVSVFFKVNNVLKKKCVPYRDIQKTKGIRSEQKIPTGKIKGIRKFDKVKYNGKEYFVKGRMSTGYAILMDINGVKQEIKPIPKLENLIRMSGRNSWIISQEAIANIA
jgi:hypothetical protein